MINNHCNLNCEYCFANKIREEEKINMTLKDFSRVIQFLKESKDSSCCIIGGEPTLHMQFIEMLDMCKNAEYLNHVHVFSNGLFNDKILKYLLDFSNYKRLSFLINFNLPEFLGNRINIIRKNIQVLRENEIDIILGVNFYKYNQPYQYLLDACFEYNIKSVRWSLVVPNTIEKAAADAKEYFTSFSPAIVRFISDCAKNKITPSVDCNNIPLCMINDEDIKLLATHGNSSLRVSVCSPVIDVLPNLKVVRCFALSDHQAYLTDFKNTDDIHKYFINLIDKKLSEELLIPECAECISYKYRERSCGCLAYKQKSL
jgi:hypothetical protein